jgi:hypothetical protein
MCDSSTTHNRPHAWLGKKLQKVNNVLGHINVGCIHLARPGKIGYGTELYSGVF